MEIASRVRRALPLLSTALALVLPRCGQPEPEGVLAQVVISRAALADDVRSLRFYVLSHRMSPSGTLRCSDLLGGGTDLSGSTIEVLGQLTVTTPSDIPASRTQILEDLPEGPDRLAYAEGYTLAAGEGNVIGRGCTEGIEITAGAVSRVTVTLEPVATAP